MPESRFSAESASRPIEAELGEAFGTPDAVVPYDHFEEPRSPAHHGEEPFVQMDHKQMKMAAHVLVIYKLPPF